MDRRQKLKWLNELCSKYDNASCDEHKCPFYKEAINIEGEVCCMAFILRSDDELDAAIDAAEKIKKMSGHERHTETTKLTRADILAKAAECVTGHRVDDYGKPENSFGRIAQLWTAYNGQTYSAHDVAMMLALLKVARISTGHGGADSYVDLAGYAACAGELAGGKDN